MPLPSTHPFLLAAPGPTDSGLVVRRGLVQWLTPNLYASGTTWPAVLGNLYTVDASTNSAGVATAPGGRTVMDISTAHWFTDPSGFAVSSTLSIDLWVRPSNATQTSVVFNEADNAFYNTSFTTIALASNTNGARVQANVNNNLVVDTSYAGAYPSNSWMHLCLVVPGSGTQTCTLYWNGQSNAAGSVSVTRPATTSYYGLNYSVVNASNFRGHLGDVKLYHVALDSNEVKQNYNALALQYGRPPIV